MTLATRAMLVNLTIRQWTARKQDKAVSAEVDRLHNACNAGRYNKLLVSKVSLESFGRIASAARDYHYRTTLPWGDNGDRLLPSSLYMEYVKKMREFRDQMNAEASTFAQKYPQLVQDARQRLGTMFESGDYPDATEVRARFGIDMTFSPVPTAGDFRAEIDQDQVEVIKQGIEDASREREAKVVKDCWRRAHEVVSKIRDRLSEKDPIFRDSLIDNARALVRLLPGLNVTEDTELNAMRREIEDKLLVSPTKLRTSRSARQQAVDDADVILAKFPQAKA